MTKRKILHISCLAFLCLFAAAASASAEDDGGKKGALTDSDDLGALGLGLEVADAMMSEDGAVEGLKGLGQDKLDDWMWESLGGYEKLYTGQLDITDPYIKQIKDKVDLVQEVLEKVQTCAEKLGAGEYDEALVTAVDFAVGQVDHPVVTVLWTSVKYAYESHKQVVESGNELKIEALYGKVESDRRLLGAVNGKADQPALIPETSESADYFFEKYIVTNNEVRDMVKAYVTGVIGDEWPEQSWGDWFDSWRAVGSGEDTARSAETEVLATEFRDKARTWIMRLIKDVNLEAKTRWAEARVRQDLIAFQQFVQKYKAFSNNIPDLLREFQAKKKYRADLPKFKEYLTKSPQALKAAKDLTAKKKNAGAVRQAIATWKSNLVVAYSSCAVIGEKALSDQLKAELRQWWAFEDEFKQAVEKQQETLVQKPEESLPEGSAEVTTGEKQFYTTVFAPHLIPFDGWPQAPDALIESVRDALNHGNFQKAYELTSQWDAVWRPIDQYYNEKMRKDLDDALSKAQEGPTQRLGELNTEVQKLNAQVWEVQKKINAIGAGRTVELDQLEANLQSEKRGLETRIQPLQAEIAKINKELGELANAHRIAWDVQGSLRETSESIREQTREEANDLMGVFNRLKSLREQQWSVYLGEVSGAIGNLPMALITGGGRENYADENCKRNLDILTAGLEQVKSRRYEGIGKFDSAQTVFELYNQMDNRTYGMSYPAFDLTETNYAVAYFEGEFPVWKSALEKLKGVTRPLGSELKEIRVLVQPADFDERMDEMKRIDDLPGSLDRFISKIGEQEKELSRLVEEDAAKRGDDADWLRVRKSQMEKFFADQVAKNRLKQVDNSYELVIKTDGDMLIVAEPYKHYMMEADVTAFANQIRQSWESYAGYKFIKANAPKVYAYFEEQLRLPKVKRAAEENFFAPSGTTEIIIWASMVTKLEEAAGAFKYDASDMEFTQQMIAVTSAIPGAVVSSGDNLMPYKVDDNHKNNSAVYNHSLGQRYISVLEKLQKTFDERKKYLEAKGTSGPGGKPGEGGPGGAQGQGGPGAGQPQGGPGGAQGQGGPGAGQPQGGPGGAQGQGGPGAGQPQGGPGGAQGQGGPGGSRGMRSQMGSPVLSEFYKLYDARLNTKSLNSASGEVALTQSDLMYGGIEVTARLNSVERIQKLLVSEDNGRTWTEIAVNQNISYRFSPMAGKRYEMMLKIKTDDGQEALLTFFPNIRGIIYQDISYVELAKDVVTKLAEAYEKQDFAAFSNLISRNFIGNRVFLEEGVRFDFDMFLDIRLKIYIDRIEQRKDMYVVETHWEKSQSPRKTGLQQMTTGKTVMTFVLEDGVFRIQNLRGNLLYATLSPEIAQTSGLSQKVVEEIRVSQEERIPDQPGAGQTENSGGVQSVSSSLTVQNGSITSSPPPPASNVHSFNFSTGTEGTAGSGDFNFGNGNMLTANGSAQIQNVTGTYTFDNLTEAPAGGYGPDSVIANGDVLVFITTGGKYGKMKVTALVNNPPVNDTVQFQYAVQTDGTKNLRT